MEQPSLSAFGAEGHREMQESRPSQRPSVGPREYFEGLILSGAYRLAEILRKSRGYREASHLI